MILMLRSLVSVSRADRIMFKKVLIANRGEIALRINRACHELGISTVAVYSTADADSLHVKFADESVCIGPPSPSQSYLCMPAILSAAEITNADAIHPGYGFLAENPSFARACEEEGISFIGPKAEVIESMGNKIRSKEIAAKAGVPLLLSLDARQDINLLKKECQKMGYPVLIKAAMGGGGRGMKLVKSESELAQSLEIASSESKSAFGSDEIYIEKYCLNPRHIEFQILADNYGNIIHLGERDCSIQRRHQKILEEAPSPIVTEDLRDRMGKAAIAAAKAVNYSNVGTVEFIVDREKNFFFLEMNTRIQVEHPITEMVTGIDLVREQILMAAGERLRFQQKDIQIRGHAIECRITAEDPVTFSPNPGRIKLFHPPSGYGVRMESTACSEYMVPPHYDSMVSKLIVHDTSRRFAIEKMKQALSEFVVQGIKTNIPLHREVLENQDFISGDYDTGFLRQIRPVLSN